jgi:hypothetical protein
MSSSTKPYAVTGSMKLNRKQFRINQSNVSFPQSVHIQNNKQRRKEGTEVLGGEKRHSIMRCI